MAKTLIATATASSSSSLSFTSGIDSTYDVYEFHFVNIHPQTSGQYFQFQVNAAGQSGFNETMTTSFFRARHNESGSTASLDYEGGFDQAQGTAYQTIGLWGGANADENLAGVLTLYAPSSTTYVKHFQTTIIHNQSSNYAFNNFIAGYINTTSAIDEISFKYSSGNIDAGTIKMFGVS